MSGVTQTLPVSAGEYFASSPTPYRRCWSDCARRCTPLRASGAVPGCSSNRPRVSDGGSCRFRTSGSNREAIACLRIGARRLTPCLPLRSRERPTGGGLGSAERTGRGRQSPLLHLGRIATSRASPGAIGQDRGDRREVNGDFRAQTEALIRDAGK